MIASAGSDEKVAWLREEVGVQAFNHRDGDLGAHLRELAPTGIDVYFDSVGGGHLEAALAHLAREGRVALCGSVSEYESQPSGPRNLFLAVSKDLTLRGFRGSSNLRLLPELQVRMAEWLRTGALVHRETVFEGLTSAPHALAEMIAGHTDREDAGEDEMTKVEERIRDKVVFLSGATGGLGRAVVERLAVEGAHLALTDLDVAGVPGPGRGARRPPGRHLAARLDVADEAQWVEVAELIGASTAASTAGQQRRHRQPGHRRGGDGRALAGRDVRRLHRGVARHEAPRAAHRRLGRRLDRQPVLDPRHRRRTRQQRGVRRRQGRGPHADQERRPALGDVGVRVNSLHPGFIGTAQLLERDEGTPRHEAMLGTPRSGGSAPSEEIAAVVAFLVSDDSTFMTGSEVYADGGYTAR